MDRDDIDDLVNPRYNEQDRFQRRRARTQKRQQFELEQAEELFQRTGLGGGAAGVRTPFNPNPNALRLGGLISLNPRNMYSHVVELNAAQDNLRRITENSRFLRPTITETFSGRNLLGQRFIRNLESQGMRDAYYKLEARSGMAEKLSGLFGLDSSRFQTAKDVNKIKDAILRRVTTKKVRDDNIALEIERNRDAPNRLYFMGAAAGQVRQIADAHFQNERANAEISQAQQTIRARRQQEIDMMTQDPYFYL